MFSPDFVRPLPRAEQRKSTLKGRKKRKSAALTDTPEKYALEEEQTCRKLKKSKEIMKSKVKKVKKKVTPCGTHRGVGTLQITENSILIKVFKTYSGSSLAGLLMRQSSAINEG